MHHNTRKSEFFYICIWIFSNKKSLNPSILSMFCTGEMTQLLSDKVMFELNINIQTNMQSQLDHIKYYQQTYMYSVYTNSCDCLHLCVNWWKTVIWVTFFFIHWDLHWFPCTIFIQHHSRLFREHQKNIHRKLPKWQQLDLIIPD